MAMANTTRRSKPNKTARLKHRRRAGCRWLVLLSFIRRLTSAAAAAPFKKFCEINDGCDGGPTLKVVSAARGSM